MRKRRQPPSAIVTATASGFLLGMVTAAGVVWGYSTVVGSQRADTKQLVPVTDEGDQPVTLVPVIEADPIHELRDRNLDIPVRGVDRRDLRDTFEETRGSSRNHEAIDILAPRNTAVLAVEDGTIARLFESQAGGTTIYQFDPTTNYAYYYAHLERYADGLREGDHVARGQVLGYVGTSGNAPKDTPHLHFAIFRLTEEKHWWEGSPINPYKVFK